MPKNVALPIPIDRWFKDVKKIEELIEIEYNSEKQYKEYKNSEAKNIISPHGLVTHMCQFYKRKSINLFNYEINNMENFYEQKIAFYEWYKNMNIMFLFLDNNIDRSIKKIIKNL